MKFNFKSLFTFGLAVSTYLAASPVHAQSARYDNARAAEIGQCIREQIKSAVTPKLEQLMFGQEWTCHRLMYLWDEAGKMNVLIDNNENQTPIFKFQTLPETASLSIFANESFANPKAKYGRAQYQTVNGYFSYPGVGPGPHRQDYLSFSANGDLLWEEQVDNSSANLRDFPDLFSHPLAIYGDYPEIPARLKGRVTTYGVCYPVGETPRTQVSCFN